MSNQYLKLRRSAVPGRIPTTGSLDFGEIALNTYDGKAYMKRSGSSGEQVVVVGTIGDFTGSFSGSFTGSLQGTSSWSEFSIYALTASSADNFTVRGTLTAQTIVAQVITSSTELITGSLTVDGALNAPNITGSLFGTSSQAISSSYSRTASFASTGNGIFSGSFSGSFSGDGSGITNISASSVVGLNLSLISSGSVTASVDPAYGFRVNANSQFSGSTQITGSLGVTGSVSISGNTGSVFSANVDTMIFTGSFNQTGSLSLTGSLNVFGGITGSLFGTSSWAVSASYALSSLTASFAISASYAVSASNTQTASYVNPLNQQVIITGSLIQGLEGNIATGEYSHAEGSITKAIGNYSHAEGDFTQAIGDYSHAEGQETIASGSYSHAEGYQTIALANHQHVQGQWNATSSVPAAFIVGNGTDDSNRSNLIYAAGNEVQISGSLQVSGGITGSLNGTSSWAVSASHAPSALTASYAISSSFAQTASFAPAYTTTSSFNQFTSSYYLDSSSFDTRILANSSSIGVLSSSFLATSSSLSSRTTILENASSSFAIDSGSNSIRLTNLESTASVLTQASASFSSSISILSSSFESFTNTYNTGSFTGSFDGRARLTGSFTGSFSGQVNGSFSGSISNIDGATNYIAKYDSPNTIDSSVIYQSGSFIAINETNFTAGNPEALYVFQTDPISFNVITGKGNSNNYLQLNIQNTNQGISASSDIVATANNGTEDSNYISMGINSENFATNFIGEANDAYVYSIANNLHIGNAATNGSHLGFFVGGDDVQANNKLQLNADKNHSMSGSLDITGSLTVVEGITGSLFGTSSWAVSASHAPSALSSSYAISASYAETASSANNFLIRQDVTASNALILGTLTAQTIVAQIITSSTDFVTGSTRFGSLLTNTHQFTGSVSITGSLSVNNDPIVTQTPYNDFSQSIQFRATNLESTASALVADSGSFSTRVTTLEVASSSFAIQSGSNSIRLTNLESTASSLTFASASFDTRILNNSSSIAILSGSFLSVSSSNSIRITDLEFFSSSLDNTFATDAELNAATASLSGSIAYLSSSYLNSSSSFDIRILNNSSSIANLSSSFLSVSSSNSIRITDLEFFSSSLDATFATDAQLNQATASLSSSISYLSSSYLNSSASFDTRILQNSSSISILSSSFLSVSSSNSTRITDLEFFSSSLDATFATDAQLAAATASLSASISYLSSSYLNSSASFDTRILNNSSSISQLSSSFLLFSGSYNSGSFTGSFTGSLFGTSSWAYQAVTASYIQLAQSASYVLNAISSSYAINADLLDGRDSSVFATTGSNIFRGDQTITGSLFTSGSNTLVGLTTLTGSLNISGSTIQVGNNTLVGNTTLSGSIIMSGALGTDNPTVKIYGDTTHNGYIRFDPVSTNINSSISASYIYVSGSTNDLYFSQNGSGYANTTRLRWLEGNLYTGLLNGGLITTQSSTVYQISSGSGIIVNLNASLNDNPYPTIQYLNWGNLTASITPFTSSYQQAFVGIDSTGNIFAQGTPFSNGQFDTVINIGGVFFQNQSTINAVKTQPSVAYGFEQSQNIFNRAFGPLKLSGYTLAPSGSSTGSLVVGSGTAYAPGSNYTIDPNEPSYTVDNGTSVSKIFRYYQSGSNWVYLTNGGAGFGAIDPANYSNNGTLTSVGAGNWSIQRVFWFPNSVVKAIVVYYGNQIYTTEANAIANLNIESFVEAPNTAANAVYLGAIVINGTGVFTSPNDFTILPGGLFRQVGGSGGGGSIVTQTLTGLSDVAISGPTNLQPFAYSTTAGKWINTSIISASIVGNASTATSASYAVTASYVLNAISSSYALSSSFASTASFAVSASLSTNTITASYALTASSADGFLVRQNLTASNALITGTLTAQTIIAQVITSSTDFVTGSTRFGTLLTNTHQFTGSVSVTGSLSVNNSPVVTNDVFNPFSSSVSIRVTNLESTSSVLTSASASFAIVSGSYSLASGSISTRLTTIEGNYLTTGSNIISGSQLITGSIIITGSISATSGVTASLFGTASWAQNAVTSSYALSALSSSYALSSSFATSTSFSVSSSFATTASYANLALTASNSLTASYVNPLTQIVSISGSLLISGSQNIVGSGSNIFSVDGISGRLFEIDDTLSGSLFSVNTVSGLPIIEAFSDNIVRIGQFGQKAFYVSQSAVGIGKDNALNGKLDISGSTFITGSLNVSGGITGSLFGTSSWAQNAVTSSYVLNAISASFASTASYVNPLNQNVLITGSLTVGATSVGANENTLILGPSPAGGAGEGGQLLLQAKGDSGYTSASMIDTWQNQFRILRGTNAASDALVAQWNLHTKQMQLPAYTSTTSFPGTATANLSVDSNGNVITTSPSSTVTGGSTNYITKWASSTTLTTGSLFDSASRVGINNINPAYSLDVTGDIRATTAIYANANGQMYFRGGDDAELWDINVANTLGVYGQQDQTVASIKLGSGGGTISGRSNNIGIGTINPTSASLTVNGNVWATSFTGSLFGTASWAQNAVTSSYILNAVSASFATTAATASSADSFLVRQSITASNALITGTLTAQTIVAQVITSSTDFVTGSTRFGSLLSNTHQFTGSVTITGSFAVNGPSTFNGVVTANNLTGSLFGTSSWAQNATSASFAQSTVSASYAQTASYANDFTVRTRLFFDQTLTDYATVASSIVGSNNLFTQATGSYSSAFFKYTVSNSTNARTGEVLAVWNGASVEFTDFSTVDLGATSPVTCSVSIVGADVLFNVQTNTSGWRIKSMATFM